MRVGVPAVVSCVGVDARGSVLLFFSPSWGDLGGVDAVISMSADSSLLFMSV